MQHHTSSEKPGLSSESISDLLSTIMVLCQGTNEQGKPVWAYLCVKPSMAKAFYDARQSESFDIADYGAIIESGEGEAVPEDVQAQMIRDYGISHDYEQHLAHAVERIKSEYLD